MILETGLGEDGGVIDRQTGEVWNSAAMEYAGETEEDPPDFEDPERWLYVGPGGSNDGYRDMEDFIATVSAPVGPTGSPSPSTAEAPSAGSKTP